MSELEQEDLQWRRRSNFRPLHHQWCIYSDQIIEGSCLECERLNRAYPATGDLNYDSMFEQAMKIYPDTYEHHEARAQAKKDKRP